MLRESGKTTDQTYNLAGAIDPDVDSGVEHGRELVQFARALTRSDTAALDSARDALVKAVGSDAVVTASIIAANFSLLDGIANAIGISLDEPMLKPSADIRDLLGINNYPSAANSLG